MILAIMLNITFSADCDGNPATKKFKESDCDVRDINVLLDIIKVNNLTKTSTSLFGTKKEVFKKPFDIGIQTWSYGRLIAINLEGLNLSILPETIGILTTLEKLELSNNNLSSLPEGFGGLKPLKYLYISNNNLSFLPNSIKNLDRLRELDLSNNNIKSLPENFGHLKSLKILNLNNNDLKSIPSFFRKFRNLVKLEISNNQIHKITNEVSDLARLKELSIRNNKISIIPQNIGNLRNIEKMNFSGNEITEIPISIGNCYSLSYLNFSNNLIEKIPKKIGQLNILETLDLSHNNISKIPIEINNLNKLIKLNLSNNNLIELPEKINNLNLLEHLDLSNNFFTEVPTCINNYNNLTKLSISNNKINLSKIQLNRLKKLNELLIQNNPLSEFGIRIQNPEKIINLDISNTEITKLPEEICSYNEGVVIFDNNKLCGEQPKCLEHRINRKKQYCNQPVVEYVDVIKEVIIEKVVKVEKKKTQPNDKYPNFENPAKQKFFLNSFINIYKLDTPDTLYALFDSPYEFSNLQPISKSYTYSTKNTIVIKNQKINEFSFLKLTGGIDLLNQYKIQLYENLKSYSENPFELTEVRVQQLKESKEYKYGAAIGFLSLSSWINGIYFKLDRNSDNLPFFLSAVVLKIIQKKLFNKIITKKVIKDPPHFNQFLNEKELFYLAEEYNKKLFKEIKAIN